MVGWRREWSIILARRGRVTVMVFGVVVVVVVEEEAMVGDAGYGGKEEEEGEDEKVVGQSGAEML